MRDYSQYALTPTKKKKTPTHQFVPQVPLHRPINNHNHSINGITVNGNSTSSNNLAVTSSPASSSVASFTHNLNHVNNNNNNKHHYTTTSNSSVVSSSSHHNHVSNNHVNHTNYQRHPNTATKSQVAVMHTNNAVATGTAVTSSISRQQQQQPPQKRDAGSISTAATQSSQDVSPRSNNSPEQPQQQPQHQVVVEPTPQQQQQQFLYHHHQQQQSSNTATSSNSSSKATPSHNHNQNNTKQQHTNRSSPAIPIPIPSSTSSTTSSSHQHHPPQQQQQYNHQRDRDLTSLTPADALSLKRDGPEATIVQLRQALEEARLRDAAEKSHLAKSDATILELRSSVRQLKRQLEKLDGDARQKHTDLVAAKQQLVALKQQQQQRQHHPDDMSTSQSQMSSIMSPQQQQQEHAMAKEERVGEMQVQLDRAHAQLLTADMVRKELEDTLEAEQYTWELRVQDQERTIVELQQEIGVLAEDLEQCRHQWKQAEEEWARKVKDLERTLQELQQQQQQKGGSSPGSNNQAELFSLREKLRHLEDERNELQTCLDEALLELEAVDAELGTTTPAEVQQLQHENQRLKETVDKQRALQQQQQLQQGDADFDTLEGLQQLYRWLLERSSQQDGTAMAMEEEKKNDTLPQTSPELLDAIHHLLETMPPTSLSSSSSQNGDSMQKVRQLEGQVVAQQQDIQAREQSGNELRANLQEAVALIKPLQDAVDKAGQQKADLQQEIDRLRNDFDTETKELQDELRQCQHSLEQKEEECDQLHHDIHRLEVELEDARELALARQTLQQGLSPSAAAAAATAAKTQPPSEQPQELSTLSKARADLKAKRAQEQTLRSLLRDAQNRFHTLNQQNESVSALNQQLQGRLRDVEEHRSHSMEEGDDDEGGIHHHDRHVENATVDQLERQLSQLKEALDEKTAELETLREQASKPSPEVMHRMHELENKLAKTEAELKHKLQSEKALSKSLKEALSLLKPMKTHLEDAEAENKELSKEVRTLRRKLTAMEISGMGTVVASPNSVVDARSPHGVNTPVVSNHADEKLVREKEQLEETVRHLEQENSQLHDALDELSRMNSGKLSPIGGNSTSPSNISTKAEVRLNQEIVELKSRYEVTQSRLEDAYVENHTLVEALKEKEESEKDAMEGMRILREKLRKTETDLQNAKYIATSALVKVEQAKNQDNNTSINSDFERESHTVLSLEEKALELDLLGSMGAGRPSPSSSSSSPSKARQFNPNQQQQYPQQHSQQQQPYHHSGAGGQSNHMHKPNGINQTNGWAGKRSRLADF